MDNLPSYFHQPQKGAPKILPRIDSVSVSGIKKHLLFLEGVKQPCYAEFVNITLENGERRTGQVLEVSRNKAVVQVFEGVYGMSPDETRIEFTGSPMKVSVSEDMFGRIFDGVGNPIDGGPFVLPEKRFEMEGSPINPCARQSTCSVLLTGITAIDVGTPIFVGTKIPILTRPGLPHNELAAQICRQATIKKEVPFCFRGEENDDEEEEEGLMVIFVGVGVSHDTAQYFTQDFLESGTASNTIMFLDLDTNPAIERVLTPKIALTTAEYFAIEKEKNVLVVISDLRNYVNAMREVRWSRDEVQAPMTVGSVYSDLSKILERSGNFANHKGSITILPIISCPHTVRMTDDPIVDATLFLSDGHILLDHSLHRCSIYPPICPTSFSRHYRRVGGCFPERTDWLLLIIELSRQVMMAEVAEEEMLMFGKENMDGEQMLQWLFLKVYHEKILSQGKYENRKLLRSFDICWEALRHFPFDHLYAFRYGQRDYVFFRSRYDAHEEEKIDGIPINRFMIFLQTNNLRRIKKERYNTFAFPARTRNELPVHRAVLFNFTEMVAYLIDQGMNENEIDEAGQTPLHLCASNGLVEMLKLLLRLGARPEVQDGQGRTAADLAKTAGHEECWEILYALGLGVKRAFKH